MAAFNLEICQVSGVPSLCESADKGPFFKTQKLFPFKRLDYKLLFGNVKNVCIKSIGSIRL